MHPPLLFVILGLFSEFSFGLSVVVVGTLVAMHVSVDGMDFSS